MSLSRREAARGEAALAPPSVGGAARGHPALEALARVCQMIAGDLELGAVMQSAMRAAEEAMNAEACTIYLRDADGQNLRFHIVNGPQTRGLRRRRRP